jgi:hypothetical protein
MILISAEVNDVARIRSEVYPYTEENVLNSSGPNIGWLSLFSVSILVNACACGDFEIISTDQSVGLVRLFGERVKKYGETKHSVTRR